MGRMERHTMYYLDSNIGTLLDPCCSHKMGRKDTGTGIAKLSWDQFQVARRMDSSAMDPDRACTEHVCCPYLAGMTGFRFDNVVALRDKRGRMSPPASQLDQAGPY